MCGRYAKAKQFKQVTRKSKKLKVCACRVQRDLGWKLIDEAWEQQKETMIQAESTLTQERKAKGKTYSITRLTWSAS